MPLRTMSMFFALLTVVANVAVLGFLGLALASRYSSRVSRMLGAVRLHLAGSTLPLAFAVALTATLGSLYYSEVAHFTPCELCWYQRIAMYPLVVVLGLASLWKDPRIRRYVLPVLGIGGAISLYHYALERLPTLLPSGSCDATAPCTVTWVWELHYISIPFMALSGFALIAVLLALVVPPDTTNHHQNVGAT